MGGIRGGPATSAAERREAADGAERNDPGRVLRRAVPVHPSADVLLGDARWWGGLQLHASDPGSNGEDMVTDRLRGFPEMAHPFEPQIYLVFPSAVLNHRM